ncbi:MAG: hypothetical protein MJK14_21490 [Rivularia sp. ALOHA_DT_140]|nr:hypothetical protein [Rivularia sp. ALOHA_DT_140]
MLIPILRKGRENKNNDKLTIGFISLRTIINNYKSTMTPEEIMQIAIAEAEKSETPFGAVIVKDNEIVERAGNTVESDTDPTCHAEVNVGATRFCEL